MGGYRVKLVADLPAPGPGTSIARARARERSSCRPAC
jgi:hypothetical protein